MRLILFWALLVFVPALGAGEPQAKSKEKEQTPDEQMQALLEAFNKAQEDLTSQSRAAKTDRERQQVGKKREQTKQEFAGRFLQLAQKHPKAENAFEALAFVVVVGSRAQAQKAMDVIAEHHLETLGDLCRLLANSRSPGAEAALRNLVEKNSNPKVQTAARLALAKMLKTKSESETVQPGDSAKLAKEAEDLYSRIVDKKDADADALEDATNELWDLRNLGIGKKAPDITGKDADGKEFKLSDYQGKVVVLDFWAKW